MHDWIIELVNKFGYWAIFLLMAAENIFPPVPSEVILTLGGFMATFTTMHPLGVAAVATAGSVAGALALYGFGRILSPDYLQKGFLGFKKDDLIRAVHKFARREKTAVFFCRFVPILRSLISIPAGMAKMHLPVFVALTAAGTFLWNSALIWLGYLAGNSREVINGYMAIYGRVTLIILCLLAALILFLSFKNSKQRH